MSAVSYDVRTYRSNFWRVMVYDGGLKESGKSGGTVTTVSARLEIITLKCGSVHG